MNLSVKFTRDVVHGVAMQKLSKGISRVLSQTGAVGVACRSLALCVSVILSTGCANFSARTSSSTGWLESGSLALSRPVPSGVSTARARLSDAAIKDLTASDVSHIVVSRSSRTITALNPGSAPQVFKAEGAQYLPQGTFSITVKEESPLWYAPNEYFTKRSLPVPEQGSRTRFMRAALGQRTLYLNDQTPIHSGPVWLREIGGVRIKGSDMKQLYSLIPVGTRVEVR